MLSGDGFRHWDSCAGAVLGCEQGLAPKFFSLPDAVGELANYLLRFVEDKWALNGRDTRFVGRPDGCTIQS